MFLYGHQKDASEDVLLAFISRG